MRRDCALDEALRLHLQSAGVQHAPYTHQHAVTATLQCLLTHPRSRYGELGNTVSTQFSKEEIKNMNKTASHRCGRCSVLPQVVVPFAVRESPGRASEPHGTGRMYVRCAALWTCRVACLATQQLSCTARATDRHTSPRSRQSSPFSCMCLGGGLYWRKTYTHTLE